MDERLIFREINEKLAQTDYPLQVWDVTHLQEFLNDRGNRKFEVYDSIRKLYDEFIDAADINECTDI